MQLLRGDLGKGDVLDLDFLCRFEQVDRVVADAFVFADEPEQLGAFKAVLVREVLRLDAHEERPDAVFKPVHEVFFAAQLLGGLFIVLC